MNKAKNWISTGLFYSEFRSNLRNHNCVDSMHTYRNVNHSITLINGSRFTAKTKVASSRKVDIELTSEYRVDIPEDIGRLRFDKTKEGAQDAVSTIFNFVDSNIVKIGVNPEEAEVPRHRTFTNQRYYKEGDTFHTGRIQAIRDVRPVQLDGCKIIDLHEDQRPDNGMPIVFVIGIDCDTYRLKTIAVDGPKIWQVVNDQDSKKDSYVMEVSDDKEFTKVDEEFISYAIQDKMRQLGI